GISAVLLPGADLDNAVLDLGAVLPGLVGEQFEIIVVTAEDGLTDDLRARAPGLPLRQVSGDTIADGCDAASFDLIFVSAEDRQFDVSELNHLLEAIEKGADVAAGYRPRAIDTFLRHLQRWGLDLNVDCVSQLLRTTVWLTLRNQRQTASCAERL